MTLDVPGSLRMGARFINHFFRRTGTALLAALTVLAVAGPLAAADGPAPGSGSKPAKPKKASDRLAVIRVHLEATDTGSTPKAEVIRSRPQIIPIQKEYFLDERDVAVAQLVETPDGSFAIQIDTTPHGTKALEMATVTANGRRMVIFGQWSTDTEVAESRWLAAPLLRGPLREGTMRFAADCDLTEARQFVDGLNNVAVKLKNQPKSRGTSSAPTTTKKPPVKSNSTAGDLINQYSKP